MCCVHPGKHSTVVLSCPIPGQGYCSMVPRGISIMSRPSIGSSSPSTSLRILPMCMEHAQPTPQVGDEFFMVVFGVDCPPRPTHPRVQVPHQQCSIPSRIHSILGKTPGEAPMPPRGVDTTGEEGCIHEESYKMLLLSFPPPLQHLNTTMT